MNKYDVTAFLGFYIEAESEERAKEIAYNLFSRLGPNDIQWEVRKEK